MDTIEVGKHCKITVIHDVPCLKIKWIGLPPSDEFRAGCNMVLELMRKHSIVKVLTDNTEAKVFAVEDQKWLNEVWLPQAQAIGYCCSAVLLPNDPFVTFAVKNIMAKRDPKKFTSHFFSDELKAIEWLKQVK